MVMNHFFYNVFISLLISSSLLYLETNSQTQSSCPGVSANLTNGVTAVLIKAPDGELLGIRVTWTIKSEYLGCQFTDLRVELYISGPVAEVGKDISVFNRTADFSSEHLDCNEEYTPRVRAVHDSSGFITQATDNGIPVVFRSDKMASPSQLPRVCVGPQTSPEDQTQGKLNISWDPLPCHLQNGADVTVYSIQYTQLPDGGPNIIVSNNSRVECRQEPGGPYSCLAASLFFTSRATYSFQVAARNSFGIGSFSNSVITLYGSRETNCTIRNFDSANTDVPGPASTTVTYSIIGESDTTVSNNSATNKRTDLQYVYSTYKDRTGWIVMESLVAIVAVLAGIVITILLIVIYVLWKR